MLSPFDHCVYFGLLAFRTFFGHLHVPGSNNQEPSVLSSPSRRTLNARIRWFTLFASGTLVFLMVVLLARSLLPVWEARKLEQVAPAQAHVQRILSLIADYRDALAIHVASGLRGTGVMSLDAPRGALSAELHYAERILESFPPGVVPQSTDRARQLIAETRRLLLRAPEDVGAWEDLQGSIQDWYWLMSYNFVLPSVDQGKQKLLLVEHERLLLRDLRRSWFTTALDGVLSPAEQALLLSQFNQLRTLRNRQRHLYHDAAMPVSSIVTLGTIEPRREGVPTEQYAQLLALQTDGPAMRFLAALELQLRNHPEADGAIATSAIGLPAQLEPALRGHAWLDMSRGQDALYLAFLAEVVEVGRGRIRMALIQDLVFYGLLGLAGCLALALLMFHARRSAVRYLRDGIAVESATA